MKKSSYRVVSASAVILAFIATLSPQVYANNSKKEASGDKPVVEKVVKEIAKAAAGAGNAAGAGIGVFFTPSKIGCGKPQETCK